MGVVVHQGVFRWAWFWLWFLVLAIPFSIVGLHAWAFRRKRWENSNTGVRTGSWHARDDGGSDDD